MLLINELLLLNNYFGRNMRKNAHSRKKAKQLGGGGGRHEESARMSKSKYSRFSVKFSTFCPLLWSLKKSARIFSDLSKFISHSPTLTSPVSYAYKNALFSLKSCKNRGGSAPEPRQAVKLKIVWEHEESDRMFKTKYFQCIVCFPKRGLQRKLQEIFQKQQ